MEQIGQDFSEHVVALFQSKQTFFQCKQARLFLTEDKRVLFEYKRVGKASCMEVSPGSVSMSGPSKIIIAGRTIKLKQHLSPPSPMAWAAPAEIFSLVASESPQTRSTLARLLRVNIPRPLAAFPAVQVCVDEYILTLPKIMVDLGEKVLKAPDSEGLFRISLSMENNELISHFDDPATPSVESISDPVQAAGLLKFFITTRPEISIPETFWRPLCDIRQDDIKQLAAPLSKLSTTSRNCLYYFLHIVNTVFKAHKDAHETPGQAGHFKTVDSIATVVSAAVINSRKPSSTVATLSGFQSVADFSSLMLTCPHQLTEMLIRLTDDPDSVLQIFTGDIKMCTQMKRQLRVRKLRISRVIHDLRKSARDRTADLTDETDKTVTQGEQEMIGQAPRPTVVISDEPEEDAEYEQQQQDD
eukprot:GILJ01000948.1.p1 GENE.GILJ01000948.1~~GILJ01000948.1.p1  ORF type:complete len:469 (-),score=84.07 GILJ01000948.1:194-1438(-)